MNCINKPCSCKVDQEERKRRARGRQELQVSNHSQGNNGSQEMGKGRTEMEIGDDGVAVITVVNPPVNALSIQGIFSRVS
uniref:Uncharacterized protein n=1 Tax=Setaria viridis TaxID=4556 RepID=A0A4U6TXD8_SETVI|nr:hypothetical protein SEVIR_7G278632v2 [Setaria viridis]